MKDGRRVDLARTASPLAMCAIQTYSSPPPTDAEATHCNTTQITATHCNAPQHTATTEASAAQGEGEQERARAEEQQQTNAQVLQCVTVCCSVLQCVAGQRIDR